MIMLLKVIIDNDSGSQMQFWGVMYIDIFTKLCLETLANRGNKFILAERNMRPLSGMDV